ncbi:MAG TPA: hypothetical protein VE132_04775 [Micromonosporaceae bacterium]|nr:hypothetical protein [Micromonosporaceae bacterium]
MLTARVTASGTLPTADPASDALPLPAGPPSVDELAARRDRQQTWREPELLVHRGDRSPAMSRGRTRLVA